MVLTAAMLMTMDAKTPSAQRAARNDPKRLQIPTLIVGHKKDRCRRQPDVAMLDGPEGTGDPYEAQSAHGFAGIDGQVVTTVTEWIRSKKLGGN
jgi:hypothetical protein